MNLLRLRHILAVARTGSFSRAAEEAQITQPALSRSIAAFEDRHGVVLFDRGRGGAHPTPAGQLVIEQARNIIAASGDLERSLQRFGNGEAGRIAFGLGPMLASLLLPKIGQELLQARPGLQIIAEIRTPQQLLPDLLDDRIEMIIGNSWQIGQAPGTEKQFIGRTPMSIIVRADHPLASSGPLTTADLAAFPAASAVELAQGSLGGRTGAFVCDNFHILRDTVLQSNCIWLSSTAFVSAELKAGTLAELVVSDYESIDSDICMLVRRGRTRSPAALIIENMVQDLLQKNLANEVLSHTP